MSTPLCPQKVLNPKFFYLKNVLDTKIFTTKSIGPQLFWTQNLSSLKLLWAQNFCGTQKFFWTQNSFAPKIFYGPNILFRPKKKFRPKIFPTSLFFTRYFCWPKNFLGLMFLEFNIFFSDPRSLWTLKLFDPTFVLDPKMYLALQAQLSQNLTQAEHLRP